MSKLTATLSTLCCIAGGGPAGIFLADEGRRYPTFRLLMNAEVTGVRQSDGRVTGVDCGCLRATSQ